MKQILMGKYKNKYRTTSARLKNYDYGSNGMYYVTICTKDRLHYFGEIENTDDDPSTQLTNIGQIANGFWQEIPKHFPFVELDEYVIMPDHMHGILYFNRPDKSGWQPNIFGRQSQNLGSVIRGFKSSLKRFANDNQIDFAWQDRYHDHVIRNEIELQNIRNYIKNNPRNWLRRRHRRGG